MSRHVRPRTERAGRAWAAAAAAVEKLCGAPPPMEPGVLRGGRRHDQAAVLRRKYAIYTAVCGLNVCATHVAPYAGVGRQYITEEVLRELEVQSDQPQVGWLLEELTREAEAFMAASAPVRRAVA